MERANWNSSFHRPDKPDRPIEVIKAAPPGRRLPKKDVLPHRQDKMTDPRFAKLNKLFEKQPEASAENDEKTLSV